MSRLQEELGRLYGRGGPTEAAAGAGTRVLVLELARPAAWAPLAAVWRGVQAELAWPAPAIAVNGVDGLQLWFSLAEPVPPAQAQQALSALCTRYLAGLPPHRLAAWPPTAARATALDVPAQRAGSDGWSAFVAPDLAAIFEDTPWLDLPPGDEAQAGLLMACRSITPAQWQAGLAVLAGPAATGAPAEAALAAAAPGLGASGLVQANVNAIANANANANASPAAALARDFLLQVMQDERAPLAQRIEAARALLAAG